jgi:hypothetical protein
MKRYISLGVVVAALCGLLGVTAGTASAVDLGLKCAKVTTPKTGLYEDAACSKVSATMEGEFLVQLPANMNFKITSKKDIFTVASIVIICQKDKGTGKIINDKEIEFTIVLEGCVIITKGKECKIANIETVPLIGQLGAIAKAEATSEMGGFFKPKEKASFATLPASAECATPETVIEGSIVCEGAAQKESVTGSVACLTEEKEKVVIQKAKKIGVLEEGAKGKEVSKEGSLKAFGLKATLNAEETITFEEALTLFA